MRIICLDTNALYNYIGRDKISEDFESAAQLDFEKFRQECNAKNTILCIADCCLMEAITLFKSKKDSLKVILDTINNQHFVIISLTKHKIEKDALLDAIIKKDNNLYEQIINKVIQNKSEVESTWLYYIAAEIAYLYVQALANEQKEDCQKNLIHLYEEFVRNKIFTDPKNIENILIEKYHATKFGDQLVKSVAKEEFYNYIFYYCLVACTFSETYKMYATGQKAGVPFDKLKAEVEKSISSDLEQRKKDIRVVLSTKFKEQPDFYETTLESVITMLQHHKMSEIQAKYLKKIFDQLFIPNDQNDYKDMAKNDIIDMISLGCISNELLLKLKGCIPTITAEDVFYVSFDKKLKNYLSSANPNSYSFIESFLPKA